MSVLFFFENFVYPNNLSILNFGCLRWRRVPVSTRAKLSDLCQSCQFPTPPEIPSRHTDSSFPLTSPAHWQSNQLISLSGDLLYHWFLLNHCLSPQLRLDCLYALLSFPCHPLERGVNNIVKHNSKAINLSLDQLVLYQGIFWDKVLSMHVGWNTGFCRI